MNKQEFTEWVLKHPADRMLIFSDPHNFDRGEKLYHTCGYCEYQTKKLPNTSYDPLDIDKPMISHAYDNHWIEFAKRVYKKVSEEIASAKGQQRLQV